MPRLNPPKGPLSTATFASLGLRGDQLVSIPRRVLFPLQPDTSGARCQCWTTSQSPEGSSFHCDIGRGLHVPVASPVSISRRSSFHCDLGNWTPVTGTDVTTSSSRRDVFYWDRWRPAGLFVRRDVRFGVRELVSACDLRAPERSGGSRAHPGLTPWAIAYRPSGSGLADSGLRSEPGRCVYQSSDASKMRLASSSVPSGRNIFTVASSVPSTSRFTMSRIAKVAPTAGSPTRRRMAAVSRGLGTEAKDGCECHSPR